MRAEREREGEKEKARASPVLECGAVYRGSTDKAQHLTPILGPAHALFVLPKTRLRGANKSTGIIVPPDSRI